MIWIVKKNSFLFIDNMKKKKLTQLSLQQLLSMAEKFRDSPVDFTVAPVRHKVLSHS